MTLRRCYLVGMSSKVRRSGAIALEGPPEFRHSPRVVDVGVYGHRAGAPASSIWGQPAFVGPVGETDGMTVCDPRPLTQVESAVLTLLLEAEFPGVDALRVQAGSAAVVGGCDCGCPSIDVTGLMVPWHPGCVRASPPQRAS